MRFFSDQARTVTTRNHLPHWQQEEATYFVTWRLKDSIPQALMESWRQDREEWVRLHPEPWTEEQTMEYHSLFSTRMDALMDEGYGECVLRQEACREILAASLGMFDGERFLMHSWVAMPNHVHALFSMAKGRKLEKVVGGWKGYSAKDINVLLERTGALWQKDYFDRMVRDWDHLFRVARYIRRNPVKAKLGEGEFTLYEANWVKKMLG
ncbi:MAG: transposase [Opitutales bacterium]|nr:transposase [Opitutales bacterium]